MWSEWQALPGPPKEPKIMAQYPKIESMGSIGSIILAILQVQVDHFIVPPSAMANIQKEVLRANLVPSDSVQS